MRRLLVGIALLAIVLAGCGGGGGGDDAKTPDGQSKVNAADCPVASLDTANKPVEITYWHAMTRVNEETLKKITDDFNASQSDVKVTLNPAASYTDNYTRFEAGLTTDVLPDLMQGDDTSLQKLIDSGAVIPMQACLEADKNAGADLVDRIRAYYTVEDVLWGMPFNNSNLVLYYNTALFERAGLDAANPPKTLEELKAASEKIVQSGAATYGMVIKIESPVMEHWMAKAGRTMVNNGNGRNARAEAVTFNDPTMVGLFDWVRDMTSSKLALASEEDTEILGAVGRGQAAMTINSSAALGTIGAVFASGEYKDVKLGVGPMPGPQNPDGGVLVGGAASYVVKGKAPEKEAAAYRFAKYLASPEVQAKWAAATGYVPVSKAAVSLPPLVETWAQKPEYKVAYDQLVAGAENDATAGPVLGPYGSRRVGMRGAITDALAGVVGGRLTPQQAAGEAASKANAAIEEYNARVG